MCLYIFSAAFCTAHCAANLARDHAPQKCPLFLLLFVRRYLTTGGSTIAIFQLRDTFLGVCLEQQTYFPRQCAIN